MRTSILLAAATATTLALASVGPSAVAQGMGGPTMTPPKAAKAAPRKAAKAPPRRTAAAPRKKTAARGFLPRAAAGKKGPGQCGTYMFWKGGKCVDARAPSK